MAVEREEQSVPAQPAETADIIVLHPKPEPPRSMPALPADWRLAVAIVIGCLVIILVTAFVVN
jgi:hypothetical protein